MWRPPRDMKGTDDNAASRKAEGNGNNPARAARASPPMNSHLSRAAPPRRPSPFCYLTGGESAPWYEALGNTRLAPAAPAQRLPPVPDIPRLPAVRAGGRCGAAGALSRGCNRPALLPPGSPADPYTSAVLQSNRPRRPSAPAPPESRPPSERQPEEAT